MQAAARALAALADDIWHAAGDTSADYNWCAPPRQQLWGWSLPAVPPCRVLQPLAHDRMRVSVQCLLNIVHCAAMGHACVSIKVRMPLSGLISLQCLSLQGH